MAVYRAYIRGSLGKRSALLKINECLSVYNIMVKPSYVYDDTLYRMENARDLVLYRSREVTDYSRISDQEDSDNRLFPGFLGVRPTYGIQTAFSNRCVYQYARKQLGGTCWFVALINGMLTGEYAFILLVDWLLRNKDLLKVKRMPSNTCSSDAAVKKIEIAHIIDDSYTYMRFMPQTDTHKSITNALLNSFVADRDSGGHNTAVLQSKLLGLVDIAHHVTVSDKFSDDITVNLIIRPPDTMPITVGNRVLDAVYISIFKDDEGHALTISRCGSIFTMVDSLGSKKRLFLTEPDEISAGDIYTALEGLHYIGWSVNVNYSCYIPTIMVKRAIARIRSHESRLYTYNESSKYQDLLDFVDPHRPRDPQAIRRDRNSLQMEADLINTMPNGLQTTSGGSRSAVLRRKRVAGEKGRC